jgi:hypothetical protein
MVKITREGATVNVKSSILVASLALFGQVFSVSQEDKVAISDTLPSSKVSEDFLYTEWAVIGAGPAGIATVGKLLDCGIDGKNITWIDPDFSGGDLAKFYRDVPSNTNAVMFKDFFKESAAFQAEQYLMHYELFNRSDDQWCLLGDVVEPLIGATNVLMPKVTTIQGLVTKITRSEGGSGYVLQTGNQADVQNNMSIMANNVVLASGSHPRKVDLNVLPKKRERKNLEQNIDHKQPEEIVLCDALDQAKLQKKITQDDTVAVFGTSHSGILILKNLAELGVKKIVSIAKKPLVFMVQDGELYFHDYTGLKGVAAQWAREVFIANPPQNLVKIYNGSDEECAAALDECTKVVYAIGFEQNIISGLSKEQLRGYNSETGVIAPNLFGVGIAFPERVLDDSGDYEQAIGIFDFIDYLARIVPDWVCSDKIVV